MKLLDSINGFMNDSDRGPGHAIGNSLLYGLIILSVAVFIPMWATLILLALNHGRVFYQEWVAEGWKDKVRIKPADIGDFYYDALMRPLATDAFVLWFLLMPPKTWIIGVAVTFLIAFKRKNQWPLLIFWK